MAQANHPVPGKAQFEVDTPQGFRPFVPPGPEPAPPLLDGEGNPVPDNPENPRGGPSLSLPQQATPLTSDQGVADVADIVDPARAQATQTVQDGLAPDDPFNPRGTPDYIVEEHGGDPQSQTGLPPEAPPPYQSYEDQAKINIAMTEEAAQDPNRRRDDSNRAAEEAEHRGKQR